MQSVRMLAHNKDGDTNIQDAERRSSAHSRAGDEESQKLAVTNQITLMLHVYLSLIIHLRPIAMNQTNI